MPKTAQQRQFEQVKDKLKSAVANIDDILDLMPSKGNKEADCQKLCLKNALNHLDSCINGIELEDFTPNEYSKDFKLSYS